MIGEDIAKKEAFYFFCYEGAIEGKNVRKSVKSQYFGLDKFLSQGAIHRI